MKHKWTVRHGSLSVKLALSSSARFLWEWLVNYADENIYKEVEFDLIKFNQWIERRRKKPYDPRTLKRAAQELVDKEVAIDLAPNRFKWNWRRWKFKDIFDLKKSPDKPCLSRSQNADLGASKPTSVAGGDLTTTTIPTIKHELAGQIKSLTQSDEALSALEENVDACRKAGISFTPESAIQVLSWHSVEEVKAALAYTLQRAEVNPAGYLRVVLENEYWKRTHPASIGDVFRFISSFFTQ
jgi:hypothetical protein